MEIRETKRADGWQLQLIDGEAALSWCSVIDRHMRIGGSFVLVGGIGGVGTLAQHRRKGYSRRVMEYAMELLRREGYHISFLHGISDFYHRFGFITCMPEYEFSLDVRDAERASGGARMRRLRPSDLPRIIRMYNRDNATRTGSARRDPRTWTGFQRGTWWSRPAGVQVVVDGRDHVRGYVVYDDVDDSCRAAEVGGSGEDVYAAILAFLARRAVKLRRERVGAAIPPDHPFAIYCRAFGLRLSSSYPRSGGHMGRIINFHPCMEAIGPELARRWGEGDRNQTVSLRTDLGDVTLQWEGDQLTLSPRVTAGSPRLAQQQLMQWLMGYVTPDDLLSLGRIRVPGNQRPILRRLFPLQNAQLWWADRF